MGKANSLMQMAAICQEFGWTYDEYMNQPNFFLSAIREKMIRDNKAQELEAKKARRR